MSEESDQLLAVFIDFENLALGLRDKLERFDIGRVIARLVEKGHIVVKRAYADWKRFGSYARPLHEHAIELIEIPARGMTGKNSADMRLCVDVMDLCYSKAHIKVFVILSGDSDFSPLVSKLKENGKTVIGLGVKQSTSDLLRDNCDEFIYYEDLETEDRDVPADLMSGLGEKEREVYTLLLESLKALRRQSRDIYWASLIKETMQRKMPAFNESYYGFRSFGDLLQKAAGKGLIAITRDASNRTHVVTAFGDEVAREKPEPNPPPRTAARKRPASKRRTGRERSRPRPA